MRIGELAERTGVATSRIRFYERVGILHKPSRGANDYRQYPPETVKLLELIDDAQRLGFTLSEVREGLSKSAPKFPTRSVMAEALRSKLNALDHHLKEVRKRRREITRLLAEWS